MSNVISNSIIKILWGRSGNRCSMPDCRRHLIIASPDVNISDKPMGEMAHIAGKNKGSARYDNSMTDSQRNGYDNLILLCPNCHVKIDTDVISILFKLFNR